jgi:AAHS family 4-hydroxybenzoate transporter-like MFS transporter
LRREPEILNARPAEALSQAPSLTVEQVIDERPLSALQIRVIALCSLVVFIDGFDLQAMALAVPTLSESWGLPPAGFGWALAASMVGMALGSVFLAPLGDRRGRKPVVICGLLLMGAASLAVTFSTEPAHLVFWRCWVGIGLGICHGNATALTAEYAPLRRRAMLMTLMGCNVALGALVAGLIAPWLIQHYDWHGLFIVGGVLPVILASILMFALPESLQLLFARRRSSPKVAAILKRMAPDVDPQRLTQASKSVPIDSVFALLKPPLRERTLRLWLIYGFNAFLLYLLISWLPVFLGGAGWSRPDALRGILMLQLGGIAGALLLSYLVDRRLAIPALIVAYLVSAVTAVMFIVLPPMGPLWPVLIVVLGGGISGALFALMAIGAIFYPPTIRATGFSWTAAVARIGAVLGPLAGGWVLSAGIAPTHIIALLAIPAVLSAIIALTLRTVVRKAQQEEMSG